MYLTNDSYERLKQHFRENGGEVDDVLAQLLVDIVRSHRGDGAADLHERARSDESAYDDLLADWYADKLQPGALAYAFDRTANAGRFIAYLQRTLENYLKDRVAPSVEANLKRRLKEILPEETALFGLVLAGATADTNWWGLAEVGEVEPLHGSTDLVRAAAPSAATFTEKRYGQQSKYNDPVLDRAELIRFVRELMANLGKAIQIWQMIEALRSRFVLDPPPQLSLEALADGAGDGRTSREFASAVEPAHDAAEIDDVARRCITDMSQRARKGIVLLVRKRATLADAGTRLGVSHGTVAGDRDAVRDLVLAHATEAAPAVLVLERIVEILS
jgi:hypothetical protein